MGYNNKGTLWNDELIKDRILEVVNFFNIDYMPSHSTFNEYYNNNSLSNKISKTGGIFKWAEKLGLKTKDSCTVFGIKYEEKCKEDLKKKLNIDSTLTTILSPYDVLYENCRIDVKVSNVVYTNGCPYFTFNINDNMCGSDIYIFYCVENDIVLKTYIIPSWKLSDKKQLSIGYSKSKYDVFINKWELVIKLNKLKKEFLENLGD